MRIQRISKEVEALIFEHPDSKDEKIGEFVKVADKPIFLYLQSHTGLTIECLKKILNHLETQE